MKKILLCIGVLLFLFGFGVNANATPITYDFDSLPAYQYYSETNFNTLFEGVSFSYAWEPTVTQPQRYFRVLPITIDGGLESPFSGNVIQNYNSWPTIATFTNPVNYASVTLGDWGGDADPIYLRAYNNLNELIGESENIVPAGEKYGIVLSLSSDNYDIAWVQFAAVDPITKKSTIVWDNFSFNPAPAPVPEPATMLLLGTGLIGLAGVGRKKFFKKS